MKKIHGKVGNGNEKDKGVKKDNQQEKQDLQMFKIGNDHRRIGQ